ncbi:MAG: hypothetical protein AAGA27_08115 [Pseudomonadota bacterium]
MNSNMTLASVVHNLPYSIGYCDYNAATSKKLSMASLIVGQNKGNKGFLVRPSLISAYAALANINDKNIDIASDPLINLPGYNSWPILMATYIVLPNKETRDNGQKVMLKSY